MRATTRWAIALLLALTFLVSAGTERYAGAASAPTSSGLPADQANWAAPNGNAFNQDYNPQDEINSSNAQDLGLNWLFPLPAKPAALSTLAGGLGVDTAPIIFNGTVYALTQYGQVFALNATDGRELWTDLIPLSPNSTANLDVQSLGLHYHDGAEQFTTRLFGGTPTYWFIAANKYVYAIDAQTGAFELNFSAFSKSDPVQGNNPESLYSDYSGNLLIDQQRGIAVTSMVSASTANAGRCFFQGWDLLAAPVKLLWTSYCSPPQPGSGVAVDPEWDLSQVGNMTGAWIFQGYGSGSPGGYGGPGGTVDLKALSAPVLNSTLYNDWGYVQSPACAAIDGGASPGATGAGWGAAWIVDEKTGIAYVNTGNKGPYVGACTPGPDLWAASTMAINDTDGSWVWGFQATPHDLGDFDCSWQQALANETVAGALTEVLFKTCKNGYLYELNAATGQMYWSWTPPTSYLPRCSVCYILDPLNSTQMSFPWPSCCSTADLTTPLLTYPSTLGEFESEFAYSPALNYVFLAGQNAPLLEQYVPINASNYLKGSGETDIGGIETSADNSTVFAVDASTGQMVWAYPIQSQGYRGGVTTSGGVVFLTLSSGDLLMLNARTGAVIKDYDIGGPLNELAVVGATSGGTMEVVTAVTAGLITWGTAVPGDIIALSLQTSLVGATGTVTATVTTTVAATTSSVTLYAAAALVVAVAVAAGYLATRSRTPRARTR